MPNWNKAQQEVLDSLNEDQNILVSAAAGSGKTAVLVERIIRTILSGKASADEILVVTFTKSAAAEMKNRIIKRLEEQAGLDETGNLSRQLALAENADIMTIDSFCNKVVRDNFSLAGVDPSFDVYDSDEVSLLKDEILDEVLDEHYRNDEIFAELTAFLMKRSFDDSDIKKIILDIFRMSESFADSYGWLEEAREKYDDKDEILQQRWVKDYLDYIKSNANDAYLIFKQKAEKYRLKAEMSDSQSPIGKAASKLFEMYAEDYEKMSNVMLSQNLSQVKTALDVRWKNFQSKVVKDAFGDETEEALKSERTGIKDTFKDIYYNESIISQAFQSQDFINCLIDIVIHFKNRLMEEKRKLKKYEFADIAHMAFGILYDIENESPTETGRRLSEVYKYIYIDEYQDSNDLQENLLNAVARRNSDGQVKNVFMVGDVKQSIYRFRLARPDLFNEKAAFYSAGCGGRLISLNMNYRSRADILNATNSICRNIMRESFGGIQYDENAELHIPDPEDYENNYPPVNAGDADRVGGVPEIICIDTTVNDNLGRPEYSKDEIEAIYIGRKIKTLIEGNPAEGIKPAMVLNEAFNKEKPESDRNPRYRAATYGDIVILQRKVKGSTPMVRIYEQMDIPVVVDDSSGYFDAMEIETLLSVLKVVDNLQQDIPLASILLSHIGGLTDIEMAEVISLSVDQKSSLADKVRVFAEGYVESEDERLRKVAVKLDRILGMIENWRKLKAYISVSDLIERILRETNYRSFVGAMPDGKRRVANLEMLRIRAESFESVPNAGLLDFLRYIEKCKIHDIDFAEAGLVSENGNAVRIMSIHKSKGLEFPIVILAKASSGFMLKDMSGKVAVDSDYHIAMDYMRRIDDNLLIRDESIKKNILKILSAKSVKTEEARLLYVAMTRAREKLYITGTVEKNPPAIVSLSKSFMDFIRFSVNKNLESEAENEKSDPYKIIELSMYSLLDDFRKQYVKKSVDYSEDVQLLMDEIGSHRGSYDIKDNPYEYIYPYQASTTAKSKLSVSEIKHAEMESHMVITDTSDEIVTEYPDDENIQSADPEVDDNSSEDETIKDEAIKDEAIEDAAIKEEARRKAALRGTVIHALFEHLDYSGVDSRESLKEEFDRILNSDRFNEEERKVTDTDKLLKFFSEDDNSLFVRMKRAFLSGKLSREKQFIAGLDQSEVPGITVPEDNDLSGEDYTVIQGIIDAFFYEEDEAGGEHIILVDYKTDNVKGGQELLDRYASQMYLYALTLEKLTGYLVKDVILYSTRFGEVHYPEWRDYLNRKRI